VDPFAVITSSGCFPFDGNSFLMSTSCTVVSDSLHFDFFLELFSDNCGGSS
jgi:hypothetical protein